MKHFSSFLFIVKDEIKNESDSTFSDKEQKSLQNILDKLDETTTIVYQNPEENQTEKNKKNITDFLEGRESNKSLESPFASKDSSKSSNSNSIAISSFSTPNKIDRSSISNSSSKKKGIFFFFFLIKRRF